jgi:hypothetical protein
VDCLETWRRLHNEELHNLHIKAIKSRRIKWAGHVACLCQMKNAYKIMFRKPEGKRLLGRPKCRWEGNIRMGHTEVGWKVAN